MKWNEDRGLEENTEMWCFSIVVGCKLINLLFEKKIPPYK